MREQRQKSNTEKVVVGKFTIRKIGKGSGGGTYQVRIGRKKVTGSLSKCKRVAYANVND